MRTGQGKSSTVLVIERGRPPTGGAVAFGAVGICFASPELTAMSILMAARAELGGLLECHKAGAVFVGLVVTTNASN